MIGIGKKNATRPHPKALGLPRLQAAAELGGPMHFPHPREGQDRESFSLPPAPTGPCQLAGFAYWSRETLKGDVGRTWASFAQGVNGLGLTTSLTSGPYSHR